MDTTLGWGGGHRVSSAEHARWVSSVGEGSRSWEEHLFPSAGGAGRGDCVEEEARSPHRGIGSSWGLCAA